MTEKSHVKTKREKGMNIQSYWRAVLQQQAEEIKTFFHEDAYVNWHNTNEHFTVSEFIMANCEYPGAWDGEIERLEEAEICSLRQPMYTPATESCPSM